ncbi:hypothetical protein [Burkholderia stagnalis]|uniref:Uncharacterized protein n=1 Tax=Burkholderia stagnalis TaxID=1503054 RepID=A0ABX9YNI2_9BURK|nr:hypothetical protein [Burkholderia stagnalis]MDY7807203.1 hypothetical protein [Burkholderia stagnalis]RQQ59649.1 hypothetical protein DF158_13935 [Burkholderia stagnalis]RQQ68946.1 hypothetical protein DF137_15200 [Burkholderia stagnalis]RQQ69487.1 hypothetical protein DF139_15485 [Burkholderia stagnalis]RQQ81254.1 hypothetical protein DF138_13805 [Burkholderia stagnalis]
MKHILVSCTLGIAAACLPASTFARTDIGVYFGAPGPVIEAPPPVYYAPPPPVIYEPAPVYYGPYYGDYRYRYYRHDNGWHRGWRHHRHHDDD